MLDIRDAVQKRWRRKVASSLISKNYIWGYKVFRMKEDFVSPEGWRFHAQYRSHTEWRQGMNSSNRDSKHLTTVERGMLEVYKGFHVYCRKKDAKKSARRMPNRYPEANAVVVRVQCFREDLVDVGDYKGRPAAVFMRYRLLPEDCKKAAKKARRNEPKVLRQIELNKHRYTTTTTISGSRMD